MKKYIKQIVALALIVSFASCSPDEKLEMLSAGGSVSTPSSISRLDKNYLIPFVVNTKEGVTATKIEIYKNTAANATAAIILGAKVSDAVIAADGKTATYNSSTLGTFDAFPFTNANGTVTPTGTTGTFALAIVSTFSDGTVTTIPYVQTVGKGIVWKDADGITTSTSGVSSFKLNDTTPVYIRYSTVKKATTIITSVVGQWSKNGGDYATLPGTFLTTKQTINVSGIPYSTYGGLVAGDILRYKFTVTSGTQTDNISTKITVENQEFDASKSGSLSSDLSMNKFNLETGTMYSDDNTTKGEIKFSTAYGFTVEGSTKMKLVKVTLDFDSTDLFEAEAAFNAGIKLTTVNDLKLNEVILYKITRNVNLGTADEPDFQDVTYYGLLKITELSLSSSQTFKFDYKEGELKL